MAKKIIDTEALAKYHSNCNEILEAYTKFDTTQAYAAGDYCVKDGILYKFTSAHAAGAWNASHVVATTVMNEIKNGIKNLKDGSSTGSVRQVGSAEEDNDYTIGENAFAEGQGTKASGNSSHAEGYGTLASGPQAHAEGDSTLASGEGSHAEGCRTKAIGDYSHASGFRTEAKNEGEFAVGNSNVSIEKDANNAGTLFTVGNGEQNSEVSYRQNAFRVDKDGAVYIPQIGTMSGNNTCIGVDENGQIKKFDNGTLMHARALGVIPDFDPTQNYITGDYVMYDGYMYIFTEAHTAGAWNANQTQQTTMATELQRLKLADYEQVTLHFTKEDGESCEGIHVAVQVEGEPAPRNFTLDAQGTCTFNVSHGLVYIIDGETISGYEVEEKRIRSALPTRRVELVYVTDPHLFVEHCVIDFQYLDPQAQHISQFTATWGGVTTTIPVIDDRADFRVPHGEQYTMVFPAVSGQRLPHSLTYTAMHLTREHKVVYIPLTIEANWVMKDGSERELEGVTHDDEDEIFGLRVATSALLLHNADYIIPYMFLISRKAVQTGQYLSSNTQIETLPYLGSESAALTDYNGQDNTARIIAWAADHSLSCSGPAYLNNQTYEINDETLHCFLPSYAQLKAFANMRDTINTIVDSIFGYTVVNVKSGNWWSSTQHSSTNAVLLLSGSFNNNGKSHNYQLLECLAY